MFELLKGESQGIRVGPRWPSSKVLIEQNTFIKMNEAQSMLPPSIRLIIVRGYESKSSNLGFFRILSRWLGIRVFCTLYPERKSEVSDIFGSNGHDVDGTHVDVSIALNEKRLRFLPFGVFTSLTRQKTVAAEHLVVINMVKDALRQCGFEIHKNQTESMQIHCDYKG